MTLTFLATETKDLTPRITVFGVGGAGGNAVNNMIDQNLEGVDFVVANTDAQALQQSKAPTRIQLGVQATEGLGAGARPEVGANAAAETLEEIMDHLSGAHMCFITAGMGGGTGTGAAPIIAQAAREMGILTVGVVTKPFAFEGGKRMRQAESGVEELQKVVDTLIIIPNQNLFRLANERTTFTEAFALADDVLYQGVKGVTDLMVRPGMINLDFADVRAVMDEMGKAMMGTGEATGEDRARQAAEKAIANPLLDEISLNGAKGVLINITGGNDLTLFELDEAANLIRNKVDPEANIIVGSTLDPEMEGAIRVSVVATGIEAQPVTAEVPRRRMAEPLVTETPVVVEEPAPAPVAEEPRFEAPAYEEPAYEDAAYNPPMFESRAVERHAERQVERHMERHPEPRYEAPTHAAYHEAPAAEPVQEDFFLEDVLRNEAPVAPQPQVRRPAMAEPVRAPQPQQYQPQPQQYQPQQHQPEAAFTAPRPGRNPGQPSPETLARLRAAVEKQPEAPARRPVAQHQPQQQAPAPAPQPEARRGLGIGSLIHRMAGHAAPAATAAAEQPARHARPQPQVQAYEDEHQHRAADQFEIPAFLRRQAN
ncbi:cell division protein FtsZ [Pararhodobacter aggregans]|uniref:Cell division protein FtsZ n=1 Tax=Pararhodobacter aggregans TaxID=404875 RepID=A0A2T7UUR6_9RHOB|nr:cell division protein FtsZ [Pararhodobacter aggregans]PTX04015.1 cell division protein FtsZ [Pararhodobacter aggregans]PVE48513.1 cell division protein FtsZ [Pararhodobacter aggregans]